MYRSLRVWLGHRLGHAFGHHVCGVSQSRHGKCILGHGYMKSTKEVPFPRVHCPGTHSADMKICRRAYHDLAVAQKHVPKWHLGKWNQRLKPA